jgi:hypothetical protein
MIGRELDEIVRELYVLPPTDFVAARNELVRQARAAGSTDIAEQLQRLRRPTRSAWLVNRLARDTRAMQRLSALGRKLRDAQTGLARTELRALAEQRRELIADLLEEVSAHAAEAGIRLTATVLSEVEATLQAALVDLAGAMTVRNGRLVRPLAHTGFGPRPRFHAPRLTSGTGQVEAGAPQIEAGTADEPGRQIDAGTAAEAGPQSAPGGQRIEAAAELVPIEPPGPAGVPQLIEDELAARRQANAERWTVRLVTVPDEPVQPPPDDVVSNGSTPELRRAEDELADAEALHWQAEFDLADAEGALEAAVDRMDSLDTMRMEARRAKVTAQQHLAEAQLRQRDAVSALAEARRRLDAARRLVERDD